MIVNSGDSGILKLRSMGEYIFHGENVIDKLYNESSNSMRSLTIAIEDDTKTIVVPLIDTYENPIVVSTNSIKYKDNSFNTHVSRLLVQYEIEFSC
jgi:hypothetical protein